MFHHCTKDWIWPHFHPASANWVLGGHHSTSILNQLSMIFDNCEHWKRNFWDPFRKAWTNTKNGKVCVHIWKPCCDTFKIVGAWPKMRRRIVIIGVPLSPNSSLSSFPSSSSTATTTSYNSKDDEEDRDHRCPSSDRQQLLTVLLPILHLHHHLNL